MANTNLRKADKNKNDEFYTQYADIQNEINAYIAFDENIFRDKIILLPCDDPEWSNFTKFFVNNFERYGIKKLISTSYAYESKKVDFDYQPTLFETVDPRFKIETSKVKGKIFTLTKDENKDGKIDEKDLKWNYLEGDGDFRSEEVKLLRDEADIIITNPPFSLFREFVGWLVGIQGECMGQSFQLREGKNFIGRAEDMDVVIRGDLAVARHRHACVIFEPRAGIFYAQPGESHELFYLNDNVVLNSEILKSHDVITLGETSLMFIPLCGPDFSWDKYRNKEAK